MHATPEELITWGVIGLLAGTAVGALVNRNKKTAVQIAVELYVEMKEEYNNLTPAHCEVRTETHTRSALPAAPRTLVRSYPPTALPRQVRLLLETGKGLPGLDAKGEPGECMAKPGPGWDHRVEKDPDAL